jgi:hypothetical protein
MRIVLADNRSDGREFVKIAFPMSMLAATLALFPGSAGSAEAMGRLFFTPAQRNRLDVEKRVVTPKAPVKPLPRSMHLDGIVTRSDADRTVWINGKAYHDNSPDGIQVGTNPATPGSTSIRVRGESAATRVKVGQHIDLKSGKVVDGAARKVPEAEAGRERGVANAEGSTTTAGKEAAAKPDKPADPPALAR